MRFLYRSFEPTKISPEDDDWLLLIGSRVTRVFNRQSARSWTADKPMFFVTLAGVAAATIYATIAAWQACLSREANIINMTSLKAVQRSFVYVKEVFPPIEFHLVNGNDLYMFAPKWQVIGSTQPVNLRVGLSCQPVLRTIFKEPLTTAEIGNINYGVRVAGPGQEISGISCFIPPSFVPLVQAGEALIVEDLRAEYDDVFGAKHITESCQLIEGLEQDRLGAKTASGKPNLLASGSPCASHNCVDESCS